MVLDYLYEIKTSRRNSILDSHQFRGEDTKSIFKEEDEIKQVEQSSKKSNIKPLEMESVHIDLKNEVSKKNVFSFLKRK